MQITSRLLSSAMKIAITGARGTVGRHVVKLCASQGHATVQVDRTHQDPDTSTPNTEMRTADAANDYDALLKAFKGCDAVIHLAAIPNPVDKDDHLVHTNNVCAAFNGMRAAAELGIHKFCYASSVNAIGLVYSNQPLKFDYFPIDEEINQDPTDAYALAKQEAETQARSVARWFPGMKIACLRIHQVAPKKDVEKDYQEDNEVAVKQLWGWVHPQATARACLAAVENSDRFEGAEVFNVVSPERCVVGEDAKLSNEELVDKYWPGTKIKGDISGKNKGFWNVEKIERVLGWKHEEKE
ncbi:hypothetical protein QBC32DRAFT_337769 [Pseudoneurospora amorphoporcata]|uniref:NAD-dependent epimerase/dehydratase domain-containing protein n=1 Tax=Pseudoneurospora amorphoporcata TaxID=241081 RepID=A0AAN6NXH0_9PEZI|nr:hypothetical protein QBC32DRAFT_337769 [Pseudoneurospora amorphoporcata]